MASEKMTISGTGCALGDFLYDRISFNSNAFRKYVSQATGDGGLDPGKLVFTEELEKFSGRSYRHILNEISGGMRPSAFNVGGPSLVSLIHASQMLKNDDFEVKFFGISGKDETSNLIFRIINDTPLNSANYLPASLLETPFTDVLSDPEFNDGQGERTFVNNIGAAWDYSPGMLKDDFFDSEIVCFGGTALVPQIHDNLTFLLQRAKEKNCVTVVNTVFDFRSEKMSPDQPWPLGRTNTSLGLIDVLIMDRVEALRISGQDTINKASLFFRSSNVGSFIITNGADDVWAWSGGRFFRKTRLISFPVSEKVKNDLKCRPELKGDTTGCGDNFAGGVIASLAMQLKNLKPGNLDIVEAVSLGIASGGFCCYGLGGTYIEKVPGEKMAKVLELKEEYTAQIKAIEFAGEKKMVLFGAGKIGRSFIAQLFSIAGYEVVFIDINKNIVEELNRKRGYRIVIRGEEEKVIDIENVRGICLSDGCDVIDEIASADIVATAVGMNGLKGVFPFLAAGLLKRYNEEPACALDIIIAENMRNADEYFREKLVNLLPGEYPFDTLVGLVETSIGKMVPIMHRKDVEEDILQVFAEPYNTLLINKMGFKNLVPDVKGLDPKENMKPWVDRKLFIHNLGHSATAYLGYLYNPHFTYIHEVLSVPEILAFVRAAMLQSADILLKMYPGEFTCESLTEHIDDLLSRFQNKALGDTVFRVGCDLKRKFGAEDRLAGAIHKAFENDLPYDRILLPLICGSYFRALDEDGKAYPGDIDFTDKFNNNMSRILTSVCGFDKHKHSSIIEEAISIHSMIKKTGLIGRPKAVNRMLTNYLYSHNPVSG